MEGEIMDDFAKSIGAVPRTQEQDDEFAKAIGATPKTAEETPTETDSWLKTATKNALQVGTMDFGDELAAAIHSPSGAATAIGNLFRSEQDQQAAPEYYNYQKQFLENLEAGKEAHPSARWLGAAAGLIPAAVTGGALLKGAGAIGTAVAPEAATAISSLAPQTMLGRIALGAAKSAPVGAGFGALQGAGEAEQGNVGEGAKSGAITGAILGPIAEGAISGLGEGVKSLRKFSPHVDETLTAAERGVENIDYSKQDLLEQQANEISKASADEFNKLVGQTGKQLGVAKEQAADLPLEKVMNPLEEGLAKQKSVRVGQDSELLRKAALAEKEALPELLDQIDNKAKAEIDSFPFDNIQDWISNKKQVMKETAIKKQELIRSIDQKQNYKPEMEYPSTFKSDAAKLESIASEVPRSEFVKDGMIPAAKIEEVLNSRLKELQILGDNALQTPRGQQLANEIKDLIKQHYIETSPNFETANTATRDLLTAKGLMGGLQKSHDLTKDITSEFKYTEGLAKTADTGKSGFKARHLFNQADQNIDNAIAQMEKSNSAELKEIAEGLKQYKANREGVVQSLEDVAMSRKLNNPNLPFYKTIAQKGANVAGLTYKNSGAKTLTDFLGSTANGKLIADAAAQAKASPRPTMQLAGRTLDQLANAQTAGKRQAIINVIQNTESLRTIVKSLLGMEDGESIK
jgi:hypothetical protein